jgi:hypothetical protein
MNDDQHSVARSLDILLDVVRARFDCLIVRCESVLRRRIRESAMRDDDRIRRCANRRMDSRVAGG